MVLTVFDYIKIMIGIVILVFTILMFKQEIKNFLKKLRGAIEDE